MAKVEFFAPAVVVNVPLARYYLVTSLLKMYFYSMLARVWPADSTNTILYNGHARISQNQATWMRQKLRETPGATPELPQSRTHYIP